MLFMWYETSLLRLPKDTKIMLYGAKILPLSQVLASKIGFDTDFEIKEVFVTVSAERCYSPIVLLFFF